MVSALTFSVEDLFFLPEMKEKEVCSCEYFKYFKNTGVNLK